jgi:hypothetical protein
VRDRIGGLLSWFASLPSRILDALGDLGGLLLQAGKNIIRGLVDGITAGFDWVKDKLDHAGTEARTHKQLHYPGAMTVRS